MTGEIVRVLVVLFSSGLTPSDVVSFHEEVARADASARGNLAFEMSQVDRPLAMEDFRRDGTNGRLRLDPAVVAEDLARRGVDPRAYQWILAYFGSAPAGPVYALSVERGPGGSQIAVASDGGVSISEALSKAMGTDEDESPRRREAGKPLYARVVLPAGNPLVFIPFRGKPSPDARVRVAKTFTALEPLRVDAYAGAWIELPSGDESLTAESSDGGATLVERVRVGYVEARWRIGAGSPAVLEADVREEALGGSLRVPRARLTVKADDERIVLREFPGGLHMGQRAQGPRSVEVLADVKGWRVKSALVRETVQAPPVSRGRPSGSWIEGEVRY